MSNMLKLNECVVTSKRVIVRADFNVPMKDGKISDDERMRAALPTIEYLIRNQAKVIILTHFGRPKDGIKDSAFSTEMLVPHLRELLSGLNTKVHFVDDCIGDKVQQAIDAMNFGEVIMLENVRFYPGETKNDPEFAKQLSALGNLYVGEAFSCCHRAHASIVGIPALIKSCPGFDLEKEIVNLQTLVLKPKAPAMAIVAGTKIETKLPMLEKLIDKVQYLVIGGGIANTFQYAMGHQVGKSIYEPDFKEAALKIQQKAKDKGCELLIPHDFCTAKEFKAGVDVTYKAIEDVQEDDIIGDIGKDFINNTVVPTLQKCATVVWNGSVGANEIPPFNVAINLLAQAIAKLTRENQLISVIGGGDTVSAMKETNKVADYTYVSTAGGAFLDFLNNETLVGIEALEQSAKSNQHA